MSNLSTLGPLMKPLMKHAAKFAQKGKKVTASAKMKAKVSIGGQGKTGSPNSGGSKSSR